MSFEPLTVLCVDDDEDWYLLTRLRLEDEDPDACVDWASGVQEGRAALARGGYGVCLVDYRLRAETGLDLVRGARAAGSGAGFVLVTGQGGDALAEEAASAGADAVVPKGAGAAELADAIRVAAGRRTVTGE